MRRSRLTTLALTAAVAFGGTACAADAYDDLSPGQELPADDGLGDDGLDDGLGGGGTDGAIGGGAGDLGGQ